MPYADLVTKKKPGSGRSVADCIEAISDAYESATAMIRSNPDTQQAFEDASELASVLRDLGDNGADLRAEAVAKIWKTEELSIAGLAEKIGVSKARAGQLLKSAKESTQKEEE